VSTRFIYVKLAIYTVNRRIHCNTNPNCKPNPIPNPHTLDTLVDTVKCYSNFSWTASEMSVAYIRAEKVPAVLSVCTVR